MESTPPGYLVVTTTFDKTLEEIFENFKMELRLRKFEMDEELAYKFVYLFAADVRNGILGVEPTVCRKTQFLQKLLFILEDPLGATFNSLQMLHEFKKAKEIDYAYVRQKYDTEFKTQLQVLIDDILQFPETSLPNQIDDMTYKMLVYIIACYSLGSPKNHVLVKQTRQSLDSIIGRGDLKDYVLKKKYHRLEYLERLGATVAGIIIYNNYDPAGEKENLRDLFADLHMAVENTREVFYGANKQINKFVDYGKHFLERNIHIDVPERKVYCKMVIDRAREVNNYVVLFSLYARCLSKLIEKFERTEYLIDVGRKKMQCVFTKLDEIVRKRARIESQAIFPHFIYLSEVWAELVNYLNHLYELNRIREQMDRYATEDLQKHFIELVERGKEKILAVERPREYTFDELIERNTKTVVVDFDLLKLGILSKDFCTLTIALTSGLLVGAKLEKKLCENQKFKFGFRNIEHAKYAERYFEDFLCYFRNAVYTSVDLILLFDLEEEVLKKIYEVDNCAILRGCRRTHRNTQTQMVVTNDLSEKNWINVTWNKWDFHRETIHWANIRKLQTKSTQTKHSFGKRNAKQQYYNVRSHMEWNG